MNDRFAWWSCPRHSGLLLDAQRLTALIPDAPEPLRSYEQDRLRRSMTQFRDDPGEHRGKLIGLVLEAICGFKRPLGEWYRGSEVKTEWTRRAITGEAVRPRHLWLGKHGAVLPVFVDDHERIGIGRGRRVVSHVLRWLREGDEQLALITNGFQWRLLFAGLDYEAFCEWDIDTWFAEGEASAELTSFRALLDPTLWIPEKTDQPFPLLAAINDSRKGQADLSQILGERVRQSAELLIQAHTPALKELAGENRTAATEYQIQPQDIYRAAVRMIMRLVVVLFAESREGLLARDNPVFHTAYSLQGLREQLERVSEHRLAGSVGAWPRVLSLLQLIYHGCSHPDLPVPAYGGELFQPGQPDDPDGMKRALHLFETACFTHDVMNDFYVHRILNLLTRTKIKIRQGRANLLVTAPVDFSSLDSEYIGILYEGLLDFELRCAAPDEPIVFLAVGNQPALPLSTLERMDDRGIKNLLEKLKDTSSAGDEEDSDEGSADSEDEETPDDDADADEDSNADDQDDETTEDGSPAIDHSADPRYTLKSRAEAWARHACEVGNLVRRPSGRMTPERRMQYDQALDRKARQLVIKVVLPGEWYLVRWGGTRKGSGTFYTRPQLAIPTVHRTLRPLAYDPPLGDDGQPDPNAPAENWTPKRPEQILSLKVCDPACGSGSFPLGALRFLTTALYESLLIHQRIRDHGGRAMLDLIYDEESCENLASEALPCRPDDDEFEPRTKAILRRFVVERCIYGVDLDPLAVELCRLSLWIETLDRSLPLTFLNHKIKCGNSLVGAWFDQFLHYPVMAWEREGGDKSHTNGVHFPKEAWTKAIKEFKKQVKPDLIAFIDGRELRSMYSVDLATVQTGHDDAEAALQEIHRLGIAQVDQRAAKYEALLASGAFQQLKAAFDLWCALWFWPADQLDHAPLPTQFAAGELDDEGREIVRRVAARHRFFHWELEFPDVFNAGSHGFDAILGNPPWDVAKPNSKEFFSAIDPLYRSYGKQEALRKQTVFFERDSTIEQQWLEYNSGFKAMGNWVKYAGFPFGDRVTVNSQGKSSHDFAIGDRGRSSFATSQRRHERWKAKREESSGYADTEHCFRHQGSADINLYKLFLEQAHALLSQHGRMGLIVPSGLYSDFGTGDLRRLFVDHCRWEWLFGFENREGIFDIHRSFKFNPVIVRKGGQTQAIRTAFMHRNLADWERGEQIAIEYSRAQVVQFSPNSRAILEIQSQRDLEVLTKIYANAVLLGDQSDQGWSIRYSTEFHMTNDSKLFPPRPKWEEWGYRPDEYSRWIKGPWKPIEALYTDLGVQSPQEGQRRCAQPPYDRLPIPRADIPDGIILSREATHFICEDEIPEVTFTDVSGKPLKIKIENEDGEKEEIEVVGPAVALPLYEGRMIGQFDFSEKGWVSGSGRTADWREIPWSEKQVEPQFIMGRTTWFIGRDGKHLWPSRLHFMDVTSATNTRTLISAITSGCPAGNKVPLLIPRLSNHWMSSLLLNGSMDSLAFDFALRHRLAGTTLNWFIAEETAVPRLGDISSLLRFARTILSLACPSLLSAPTWLRHRGRNDGSIALRRGWRLTRHRRMEGRASIDAIASCVYGLNVEDLRHLIRGCDVPLSQISVASHHPKGFWRIDKTSDPEQRHTILSLIAFHDLQDKISACGGDLTAGIEAFCSQNDGEGWMLPETLRLADYGLGHDERAKQHQPVRECFGPRFYDWQLAQSPEESWRECHLHARNLLGPAGYQALLDELEGRAPPAQSEPEPKPAKQPRQRGLFET